MILSNPRGSYALARLSKAVGRKIAKGPRTARNTGILVGILQQCLGLTYGQAVAFWCLHANEPPALFHNLMFVYQMRYTKKD